MDALEVEQVGDVTVIRLTTKQFDLDTFDPLTRTVYRLVDREERKKLVLNLKDVKYLFSEAVGMLVSLNNRLQNSGCQLRLCNLDANVREVIDVTHVSDVLAIHEDEQRALEDF